ncbi:MAG: 2-amino-4-hydroxy-6-hydroxymethyldihydropteridine diphosphokinase [Rikenellaceae bacterium]
MTRVVLISGGNLGDARVTLLSALDMINQRVGQVVEFSTIHYSRAWGFESEQEFANQVIVVDTELDALCLLDTLQEIEAHYGRNREKENLTKKDGQRYCSRSLDIDILFYGEQVIDNERLVVPHKLMCEREFVLKPLCEIMADYHHPFFGESVAQLLAKVI